MKSSSITIISFRSLHLLLSDVRGFTIGGISRMELKYLISSRSHFSTLAGPYPPPQYGPHFSTSPSPDTTGPGRRVRSFGGSGCSRLETKASRQLERGQFVERFRTIHGFELPRKTVECGASGISTGGIPGADATLRNATMPFFSGSRASMMPSMMELRFSCNYRSMLTSGKREPSLSREGLSEPHGEFSIYNGEHGLPTRHHPVNTHAREQIVAVFPFGIRIHACGARKESCRASP